MIKTIRSRPLAELIAITTKSMTGDRVQILTHRVSGGAGAPKKKTYKVIRTDPSGRSYAV